MKKNIFFMSLALLTINAIADDTIKEKAAEVGNDARRGAKNTVREVKDKTCEMVNGKMECAVQKAKHTIQKGADKVEDAVD